MDGSGDEGLAVELHETVQFAVDPSVEVSVPDK